MDIKDQVKDLGYESHNTVGNLKTLAVLIVLYFAKLFILLLIKLASMMFAETSYAPKVNEWYKSWYK